MDQFGKQRLKDFYIDPNYVNVNSGSYGYSPKVVFDYQRELLLRAEFNNDLWFRRDLEQFLKKSRAFVGNRINCPASNLVYLINGTDGINSLAKSIIWKEGDVVLVPNTTYVSTQKTFARIKDEYKIVIKTVRMYQLRLTLPFPITRVMKLSKPSLKSISRTIPIIM